MICNMYIIGFFSIYLFIFGWMTMSSWGAMDVVDNMRCLSNIFPDMSRGKACKALGSFPSAWAWFPTWINCQCQQVDILRQRWHHCGCTLWVIFQQHNAWLQGQKVSLTTFKLELKPVMRCSLLLFRVRASLEQPGEYSKFKEQTFSWIAF